MKKSLLLFFFSLIALPTFSQTLPQDAVKQTVNTLFEAMRKGDSTMLRSIFAKELTLQSISQKADGTVVVTTEKGDDFVKVIAAPHKEIYDEQIKFNDIKIDGDLASVWAPYKFYFGKQFSHCGVDVFQLVHYSTGWKIIYIVDTRRKDNCPE